MSETLIRIRSNARLLGLARASFLPRAAPPDVLGDQEIVGNLRLCMAGGGDWAPSQLLPNAFLQRLGRSCSRASLGENPAGCDSSSGAVRLPWIPSLCAGHGMSRCAENAVCQEKAERREMHLPRRLCRSVRISSRCLDAL